MSRWYRCGFLLVLVLSACALPSKRQITAPATWAPHQASVMPIIGWNITGRLVIADDKHAWNLQFSWEQHQDHFLITLRDPLGRQVALMNGNADWVKLIDAKQVEYQDQHPESLLQRVTGYRMPITNLQKWILGLPVGAQVADQSWDEQGRLLSFAEDGWLLEYKKYDASKDIALPSKLFLSRAPYQVKILVSKWSEVSFR